MPSPGHDSHIRAIGTIPPGFVLDTSLGLNQAVAKPPFRLTFNLQQLYAIIHITSLVRATTHRMAFSVVTSLKATVCNATNTQQIENDNFFNRYALAAEPALLAPN